MLPLRPGASLVPHPVTTAEDGITLVDLFEYQARDVFEKHGVPVLAGAVATTPQEARAAAETIGAKSGGVTAVSYTHLTLPTKA